MTEVEADRMTGKRKATGFPIKDVGNGRKGCGFLPPSPLAGEGRGEGGMTEGLILAARSGPCSNFHSPVKGA